MRKHVQSEKHQYQVENQTYQAIRITDAAPKCLPLRVAGRILPSQTLVGVSNESVITDVGSDTETPIDNERAEEEHIGIDGLAHAIGVTDASCPRSSTAPRDYYSELLDALARGDRLFEIRLPHVHASEEGAARDDVPDDSAATPFSAQQVGKIDSRFPDSLIIC